MSLRRPSQEVLELVPLLQVDHPQDLPDMALDDDTRKEQQVDNEKYGVDEVQVERASSTRSSQVQPKEFVMSDEEKRLVRKLDIRIMPIACILYLFACKSGVTTTVMDALTVYVQSWTGRIWATLGCRGFRRTSLEEIRRATFLTGQTPRSSSPT